MEMRKSKLAGLILAGGEGRRFGQAKAFATLDDGRTFLEVCAATLIGAGASPLVATMPPGTDDTRIDGLESIALPEPGMDMFASLVTGLRQLVEHPDWRTVAILPVDHPLVHSSSVSALVDTAALAAIPSYRGKHGHPVCLARSVAERILSGDLGGPTLREVLRSVGAVDVDVNDPGVATNCNTPDALREALKLQTTD